MFDVTLFSSFWPKGLFLSQQLSKQGKKVCYVDLQQEALAPLGVFIQENPKEKVFLESLGLLLKQNEGFCLLSCEGGWSFQEIDWQNMSAPLFQNFKNKELGDFKNHWLSFLSKNLMSRVFEGNHFIASEEGLDFFSDYFLFEMTLKQKNQFKLDYPDIHYVETSLENIQVLQEKSQASFSIKGENIESHQFLWLADDVSLLSLFSSNKIISPEWEWKSFSFEGNLDNYGDIIPSHFVSLKDLSLPWTHDNLLSVFYRDPHWEVWFKQAYSREDEDLLELILNHLNQIFKEAVSFKVIPKKYLKSFCIYGEDKLKQKTVLPKNVMLPSVKDVIQGDLLSQLKFERQLLEKGAFS